MRHVAIFARQPALGRTKTRLAAEIGAVEALRFHRATLGAVCRRLARDGRWATWLAVTPDDAVADDRLWPRGILRLPQGGGDLGMRMARCLSRFGHNPAVIVGSDVPDIAARHVAAAFDALRRNDLVFGPAGDGGYWLVGARAGCRVGALFDGVRWSTEHAIADTLANVRPGVGVAMLETLSDIDDAASLRDWQARRMDG